MIYIYKTRRNLLLFTVGMIMGCVLAYIGHIIFSPFLTVVSFLMPFIIAILVGVAKTTTA